MAHLSSPDDPKFDDHYSAIGRLVDKWAQLEFQIDRTIWDLAEVEQMYGACITAQLIGINGRGKALNALVQIRGGSADLCKKVRSFTGGLGELALDRHRAAHDPRMAETKTGRLDRLEVTASHVLSFSFQPESIQSLKNTTEKIHRKIKAFMSLKNEIIRELDALGPKSRPKLTKIIPVKGAQNPTI